MSDNENISLEQTHLVKPKLSIMMEKLYGKEKAREVYDICQQADPYFNKFVQEVVYDQIWALPGLSLQEKSLVTISALTTIEKETQLGIHLDGYLNLQPTPNKLKTIFDYMVEQNYINPTNIVFSMIEELSPYNESAEIPAISKREKTLIDIVYCIATGNLSSFEAIVATSLNQRIFDKNDIAAIMRHQMIYCGCPCTMNGFAILNKITDE